MSTDAVREIDLILNHDSPSVFRDASPAVAQASKRLETMGDEIVPHVVAAISRCAAGSHGGPRWWDGAPELCKVLSRIHTSAARAALITIVRTDSNVVEFDRVRSVAALELGTFDDPDLVAQLVECLDLPHAPTLALNRSIESLGGNVADRPEIIIARGQELPPEDAIPYFQRYEDLISAWPTEKQYVFYYFFGVKVRHVYGGDAAKPLLARALVLDPDPLSAAWLDFPESDKTPEAAKALAEAHPLDEGDLKRLKASPGEPVPDASHGQPQADSHAEDARKPRWRFWRRDG